MNTEDLLSGVAFQKALAVCLARVDRHFDSAVLPSARIRVVGRHRLRLSVA